MTQLEAIDVRCSIRDFDTVQVSQAHKKKICEMMETYNKQAGITMAWLDDASAAFDGFFKSYGMFKGVRAVIVLKGPKSVPDLAEKLGYYGEMLVLDTVALGLGTCWVGGTFDKKSTVFKQKEDEDTAAVIVVGHPTAAAKQKQPKKKKKAKKLYMSDRDIPSWFADGMNAVSKAPSAINRQPVKFYYINDITWAKTKNTATLYSLDRGIAKAHFDIAAGGSFEFGQVGIFSKKEEKQ
jgi:Nitroreductase family.